MGHQVWELEWNLEKEASSDAAGIRSWGNYSVRIIVL